MPLFIWCHFSFHFSSNRSRLNVIKDLLEKDEKLNDRTVLSVHNITELLGFCLHNTYFSFQNKFYEQVEGVPMGSPVSPIVANLYMESFERKAPRSANNPPRHGLGLWMTRGSSNNRHINKNFWIILMTYIQQSSLQWKGIKGMGLYHSLTPCHTPSRQFLILQGVPKAHPYWPVLAMGKPS